MSEAKRNASNVANLWEIYSQKVFQRKSKPYRQPWKGNLSVCPQVLDKIRTVTSPSQMPYVLLKKKPEEVLVREGVCEFCRFSIVTYSPGTPSVNITIRS